MFAKEFTIVTHNLGEQRCFTNIILNKLYKRCRKSNYRLIAKCAQHESTKANDISEQ